MAYLSMDKYFDEYPGAGVECMMDVMEIFYRLSPLEGKNGWQAWRCCCQLGFKDECCSHSSLLTALWEGLHVPAAESTLKIKNSEGKKRQAATQWTIHGERKTNVEKEKALLAHTIPNWHPTVKGPPAEEEEEEKEEAEDEDEEAEAEEGSDAALQKHKYPEEKAVPPARRRLEVSIQEVVKKVIAVKSTKPIPELDPKLFISS
jgi:hypothetical protein